MLLPTNTQIIPYIEIFKPDFMVLASLKKVPESAKRELANSLGGVYGSHTETSSITIPREPVGSVISKILSTVLGIESTS